MRHLKLLFVAVVMSISTSAVAGINLESVIGNESVSFEIEKMLSRSNLIVEDDMNLRIVFTISENREILVQNIKSDNEEVNAFILKRLQNKKVFGRNWEQGKLYELPIKVHAVR